MVDHMEHYASPNGYNDITETAAPPSFDDTNIDEQSHNHHDAHHHWSLSSYGHGHHGHYTKGLDLKNHQTHNFDNSYESNGIHRTVHDDDDDDHTSNGHDHGHGYSHPLIRHGRTILHGYPRDVASSTTTSGSGNGSTAEHHFISLPMVHAPCWCDVCGAIVVAAHQPSLMCGHGCGYRVHEHCRSQASLIGCIDLRDEEDSWQVVADNEWRMPQSTAIWLATPHLLAAMLRYLREDDLCVIRCSHTRLRAAVDRKPIWSELGFRFLHIPSLNHMITPSSTPLPASSIRLSPSGSLPSSITASLSSSLASLAAAATSSSSSSMPSSVLSSISSNSSSFSSPLSSSTPSIPSLSTNSSSSNAPDFAIALSLGLDPPRLPPAITIAIHVPSNIRDKMYSWLFGPEFCEQYRSYIARADMHLRAKLKVGGAIIPILVFMAPPEEESWIRTKYDGHLIVLDATADGIIEEYKEKEPPAVDEFDFPSGVHGSFGSVRTHMHTHTVPLTARERYNHTKVGLMNRIKEVGRHQGHEPHVAFIALVNKMDPSPLSLPAVPAAAVTTNGVAAGVETAATHIKPMTSLGNGTSSLTDPSDPFEAATATAVAPEVDRSDEVTCFLALVHLAREVRESQGFSLIPGNVNSSVQGEMPTPGERIADVSKDLSKVAGTAVRVAGCVPLFVVGHGLLNLPLYSLVGVGVGAGTGWFTVDHKVQRALPKQLQFLSKPAAAAGAAVGGICGLGVFGLAGLGLTLRGGLNDGMELALKGRVTATGGASMPLHLILSEMAVGQPQ